MSGRRPAGRAVNDPGGMADRVAGLPDQLRAAWTLAQDGPDLLGGFRPERIYVCGMGGSAIGGDFLRAYAGEHCDITVDVIRGYELPRAANDRAFVFFVSYSGNTEETLAGWDAASERRVPRAVITTGGELGSRARAAGVPCLEVPPGSPPRAALGWTSIPLFAALSRAGLLPFGAREVESAARAGARMIARHGPGAPDTDPVRAWAEAGAGRLPVIYAPASPYAPCAVRWACQINENAKSLAHVALFPEHNHNEIVGWEAAGEVHRNCIVAFLAASVAHPRVRRRMELVAAALRRAGSRVEWFEPDGEDLAARLYSLAVLGDLVSLHLAAALDVDPTPVASIDRLKGDLGSFGG